MLVGGRASGRVCGQERVCGQQEQVGGRGGAQTGLPAALTGTLGNAASPSPPSPSSPSTTLAALAAATMDSASCAANTERQNQPGQRCNTQ